MYIRRGIKITPKFNKEADAYELDEYMKYAKDFYDRYFMKYPNQLNFVPRTVYLATEEPKVLKEAFKK